MWNFTENRTQYLYINKRNVYESHEATITDKRMFSNSRKIFMTSRRWNQWQPKDKVNPQQRIPQVMEMLRRIYSSYELFSVFIIRREFSLSKQLIEDICSAEGLHRWALSCLRRLSVLALVRPIWLTKQQCPILYDARCITQTTRRYTALYHEKQRCVCELWDGDSVENTQKPRSELPPFMLFFVFPYHRRVTGEKCELFSRVLFSHSGSGKTHGHISTIYGSLSGDFNCLLVK